MAFSQKAFREETVGLADAMLQQAEKENRDLTPAEQAKFETLLGTFSSVMGREPPREHAAFRAWCRQPQSQDDGLAGLGLVASNLGTGMGRAPQSPAAVASPPKSQFINERGEAVAFAGAGESFEAAVRAHSTSDNEAVADELSLGQYLAAILKGPANSNERAALSESEADKGGYAVPSLLSARIIDLYRSQSRVAQAGAGTVQLGSESESMIRITSDPVAGWVTEVGTVPEGDATFGRLTFRARDLRVLVKVSRNLLQDSTINMANQLERQLATAIGQEVDRVALFGDGVLEPLGVKNDTDINQLGSIGALDGFADVLDAWKLLLDDNVPSDPTALIMANQEWLSFAKMEDTTGQPLRRPQAIEGLPFLPTTKATAGEMFLGWWPDLVFAVRSQLRIERLNELFAANHQVGFLAHMRLDIGTLHSESFCRMSGITV